MHCYLFQKWSQAAQIETKGDAGNKIITNIFD